MDIKPDKFATWRAECSSGKKALGGGVSTTGSSPVTTPIYLSAPAPATGRGEATAWQVGVYHNTTFTARFYAWVVCANVS